MYVVLEDDGDGTFVVFAAAYMHIFKLRVVVFHTPRSPSFSRRRYLGNFHALLAVYDAILRLINATSTIPSRERHANGSNRFAVVDFLGDALFMRSSIRCFLSSFLCSRLRRRSSKRASPLGSLTTGRTADVCWSHPWTKVLVVL